MESDDGIIQLAKRSGLVRNPSISFLAEGFGNKNYLLEEAGKKFVLRIKKLTELQFLDSLEKENSFLKYFEHEGINFCPKALFYDQDKNFLIEDFLEGKLVPQKNFSNDQIDLFAQQLHTLFTLSVSSFSVFCKKNDLKFYDYIDPVENLRLYGFNRFEEIEKDALPKEIVEWIEKTLEENLEYLENINKNKVQLGFAWGDIQSELIISSNGKMNFYDFEHAKISNSLGLSFIKIHGSFSKQQLNFLIERCAHYFDCSRESLLSDMNANEKIVRTNDVIWAAMKWATTGEEEFKRMTYRRIDLVEK